MRFAADGRGLFVEIGARDTQGAISIEQVNRSAEHAGGLGALMPSLLIARNELERRYGKVVG